MSKLLSSLPVGAKIKFGKYSVNGETAQPITWLIVAKNHISTPAYPSNSVTLLTERVIDIRAFDAKEPTNSSGTTRNTIGNNRYSLSNLDQWLNKSESSWYVASHTHDQPPTNDYTGGYETGYDTHSGFLNAFSNTEINSILSTNIRVNMISSIDGAAYEDISRKVFLPSMTEVGYAGGVNGGSLWEYFTSNSKLCPLTTQAQTYSLCTSSAATGENYPWWLRTSNTTDAGMANSTYLADAVSSWSAMNGRIGVRPALNISSSLKVSDTTDNEGCYTMVWNTAPTAPSTITTPNIYGGKTNTISWNKVTDPDGDVVTYQLECSINGGSYTQIYKGTSLSYAHLVAFGTSKVTYRVKAIDPSGESSAYTTSATLTVVNNNAPAISGTDSNLGVKSEGFTGTYTVTDANNNAVTVTESIDGVQIRSLVATLGATITYGITGATWLALPNGSHTLTIRATDGIDSSVRTYTFTKLVNSFTIQNSTPWVASTRPSRIMVVVTSVLPVEATFKVEVCNNGYDSSPTWEDATSSVKGGLIHQFTNTTKTATNWGVLIRVSVNRNGGTGACYVSNIGGNFE